MRVLNLYAGLGGNRKLWQGCEVVAVESEKKIADVYKQQHPSDTVIIADAHDYLKEHFSEFDFIWSSPPCQTHSKMNKATRHKNKRFPDLKLYEEIIFLQNFFAGLWVVENVVPYYEPLVPPTAKVGRHLFWANFNFFADDVKRPKNFINLSNKAGEKLLKDWLGIHYDNSIYYKGNHCPAQVLRNCVHPDIGLSLYSQAKAYRG